MEKQKWMKYLCKLLSIFVCLLNWCIKAIIVKLVNLVCLTLNIIMSFRATSLSCSCVQWQKESYTGLMNMVIYSINVQ